MGTIKTTTMSKTAIQQAIEFIKENCIFEISEDEETVIQINNDLLKQKLTELKDVEKQNFIDFHIEVMKIGLIEEGEKKWLDDYEPKIREVVIKHYNETFND